MKKVFQTIVDRNRGNCMQAAIASLLDLELESVPDFIEYWNDGILEHSIHGFLDSIGYDCCLINKKTAERIRIFYEE